jgi:dipeptidyl aminopeptidase/acylaminoacyl peptidase
MKLAATPRTARRSSRFSSPTGWVLLAFTAANVGLLSDAALCGSAGQSERTSSSRLPREQLLVYRDAQGQIRTAQSPQEWELRRAEIRRGMEAIMGRLPGPQKRCPLEVQVEEQVDAGPYLRQKLTYQSEPSCRVPAYLLIPKAIREGKIKKAPAVLCLHPTDNTIGHGVVVGLGGRANRAYAAELAERGFVTFAPNYPLLAQYQPDLKKLGWESGTLKAVWDNIRALDYLQSLPYVDGRAFGAIGHSLGGHNSIFTAVWDERIQVVVSSCGFDSFLDYYGGDEKNWQPERGWCQLRYMPKLAQYRGKLAEIPFDFYELIAALAPRHVLVVAPQKDHNFQVESVRRIITAARPVFALYGQADRLQAEYPEAGHDFPEAMRHKAYQLLDTVLRTPAPRQ